MTISTNSLDFIPEIDDDILAADIFDLDEIQRMQDLFSDATGVASIITHPNGDPITKPSNFCTLCKDIIRKTEKGRSSCFLSDSAISGQNLIGPTLNRCFSVGLWDAGASINIGNKHIANWLIGQVRNEKVDEEFLAKYADEIGVDKDEFINAFNKVPIMSADRFKKVAEMLFVYANDLSDKIYKNLQQQKQLEKQAKTTGLLQQSEQFLSITLQSIGEGVISTDNNGRIVNMNGVAEKLCGWNLSQAKEKPLDEVFCIVNAELQNPVSNPVLEVLETGKAINLRSKTVLVSKTGCRYCIAFTASPIRDHAGKIYGVVLVFSDISEKHIAQQKLRESERSKSVLLSNIPGAAYRCKFDRDRTLEFISEGVEKLTGYKPVDILYNAKKAFNDLIVPAYRDFVWEEWKTGVANKSLVQIEYQIQTAHNQTKWVWEQGVPIYNKQGEIEALEGILIDITERKEAEEALVKSEEKYRTIFENVQDVFYQVSISGDFRNISPSVETFTGYTMDEATKNPIENLYARPEDRQIALEKLLREGQVADYEVNLKTKDGTIKHASLNAKLGYDSKGNPAYIDGFIRDITARKLAEKALYASEKKFRNYIEYAPHAVVVVNRPEKYIEINNAACRISGYTKEELCSISQAELFDPESYATFRAYFEDVQKENFASRELKLKRKDGSICYVIADAVKLADQVYLGFIIDITNRKKEEEKLVENEKFLKETQTIAVIGHGIYDFKNQIWRNSEILNRILGLEPNAVKTLDELIQMIHPDWQKQLVLHFEEDLNQNQSKFNREFVVVRQNDKGKRWLHAIGEIQYDEHKEPVKLIATIQDITEQKNTTIALRDREEMYRSILHASPDAIVIVEMNGIVRMVSPAALPIYGCEKKEELLGVNMFDIVAEIDRERAVKNTELMFNGYMGTVNYQLKKANGDSFFAEVNGDIIWDQDKQPIRMVFIIRDITQKKQAEDRLKKSQKQLKSFASHLQNIREEERVLLAREIHDELGQILIALKIDLGIMKQKTLKLIKKTDAADILTNFDNLFGLVDNTIKTTRKIMTDLRPEVLYLLGFVEAVRLQVHNFQDRHQINCYFDCTTPKLELNTQQSVALFRIVQESLNNIAKHSKATSSKILIFEENDKLVLEISDNGVGMKENQKVKHDSYGLIGMKERVFLLDGTLNITSRPGEGTKIKIEIPCVG